MAKFDLRSAFREKVWLEEITGKLREKLPYSVQKAHEVSCIPYTTKNGQWQPCEIGWWTNGFWPASMWQMYRMTGEALYREEAIRAEGMLDAALRDFKNVSHDAGFMWLIQSGVHYHLEKNQDSFDRTMLAADLLMSRFNPLGFIRAWNGPHNVGKAIIDCMMNLPLLYWASREEGDPRFKKAAMIHADTAMKYFLREDGSCNHIVDFDPQTGSVRDIPAGQGSAPGSSWSRGQAWGLYGFLLSYLNTGEERYLDSSICIADYFLSQIQDDFIPRCDFRQPAEPLLKDNAAGNIAACGLLELAKQLEEGEAQKYFEAAVRILKAQEAADADWSKEDPAIFQRCCSAYSAKGHMTMNYADYFFIEAINKLRGEQLLFWMP